MNKRLTEEIDSNMVNKVREFFSNELDSALTGISYKLARRVNGYDIDWYSEDEPEECNKAIDNLVDCLVREAFKNYMI